VQVLGIDVDGVGGRVERNTLDDIDGVGIRLLGEGGVVASNRLDGIADGGIWTDGTLMVIDRNTVENTGAEGVIHIGSGVEITRNTVRNIGATNEGIQLLGVQAGLVSGNRLSDVSGHGVLVSDGSHQCTIIGNRLDRVGADDRDGIVAYGAGHEMRGNKVSDAGRDGIHAEGDDVVIAANQITRAGEDGIDLDSGSNCLISKNKVSHCLAEGIENNAAATTVDDNVSKGNRTDFADTGSLASFAGNQSSDGTDGEAGKASIDS